ncbi:sulfotransferase domain-containing protein [Muricauda sp. MAR_2010_75]|uniref:sulfotransferase domain-containing protein n=1 Tax=Allomuricauda sp. MAR_2010_75 TaxID=1250232 RepID=UPI00056B9F23|nr:sulfotransferase domain-containing protein [Muricauda sp. MAR_2010_75]
MKINTFIIGVQKGATTSLYEWLIQHPDVCGELYLKDYPFFSNDELFNKGFEFIEKQFTSYDNQKIVITGCVDYVEDKQGLIRIKEYNPEARIILLLRKPEERLKSAFKFLNQISLEKHNDINKAIESDSEYMERSLYGDKLDYLYSLFPEKNIKVMLFENVTKSSVEATKEVFSFLGVSENLELNFHNANKTGAVRFKYLNKLMFDKTKDNIFRASARKLFDPGTRVKLRRAIKNLNTTTRNDSINLDLDEKYRRILENDMEKVKKYVDIEGSW